MGLLETIINKFFPSLSDEEMAGIMLDMKACWEISKIKQKNCSAFFRTLNNLVPAGATLCFEGTSISKDVKLFLEAHRIRNICEVLGCTYKCYCLP